MSCLCGHSWVEHPNGGICIHRVDGVICACLKLSPSDMPDFGTDAEAWRAYILTIRAAQFVEIHKQFEERLKKRDLYQQAERDVVYSSLGPQIGTIGVGVTGPATKLAEAAQTYAHERSTDGLLKLERAAVEYASTARDRPISVREQSLHRLIAAAKDADPLEQAAQIIALTERGKRLGEIIGQLHRKIREMKERA